MGFFGLFMLLSHWIPWLNYEKRITPTIGSKVSYFRSFIIGAVFTLGWTACVGPILAGILALASVRATAWQGAYLLAVYSLGLGLPFLIIGAFFGSILPLVKRINRYSGIIQIISAILLIGVGIVVLLGKIALISTIGS
jgi:cytochrome c-type biogenesis protein